MAVTLRVGCVRGRTLGVEISLTGWSARVRPTVSSQDPAMTTPSQIQLVTIWKSPFFLFFSCVCVYVFCLNVYFCSSFLARWKHVSCRWPYQWTVLLFECPLNVSCFSVSWWFSFEMTVHTCVGFFVCVFFFLFFFFFGGGVRRLGGRKIYSAFFKTEVSWIKCVCLFSCDGSVYA